MRLISEIIIIINKGLMPQVTFDIYKSGCQIYSLKFIEDVEENEKYSLEIVYSNRESFLDFVNNLDNHPDKFTVLSVANALEGKIKGGLLTISGKLPLETITDYEINLLGATGLIQNKIKKGSGAEYSGISTNIGVIGCIKSYDDPVNEHYLNVYLAGEKDSVIISSLTEYTPIPLVVDYSLPEDLIKTIKRIEKSFAGIRLIHVDEPALNIYEQIYSNINRPMVSYLYDDVPLALLTILGKLLSRNRLKAGEITMGIIGLNVSLLRITRMLVETGYYRVLGYDFNENMMLSFENNGGLGTTTENILSNADIIILVKNFSDSTDMNKVRPGQYILTMPDYDAIDIKQIKSRGIRELIRIDNSNLTCLYPGLLKGLIKSGANCIDDASIIKLSGKLIKSISDTYQFPDIFSGIHERISEFINQVVDG